MLQVPPRGAAKIAAAAVACAWTVALVACQSPVTAQGGDGPMDGAAQPADGGPMLDDAASVPDAFVPECSADGDCGAGRGCLAGVCRNECVAGFWCDAAASGPICQGGLCVECTTDADCDSGREQCDEASSICVDRPFDPSVAKFGIFYSTWHCLAAHSSPVHDLSRVLAGQQGWGPANVFYYWDQPAAGYYCPSENDAVLRQHAEMLRDAGISFAFIDATNHAYVDARSHDTPGMILRPLDRLLAVWSTVPGAPRLVPWVPVVEAGTSANVFTVDAMLQRLAAYPGMQFAYLGKPLLLITENMQYPVNAAREAQLATQYTVRRMWGLLPNDGTTWSFLQRCQSSPTSSAPCDQRVARVGGAIEQIAIGAAYQATFMNVSTATPKHRGLTFRKQFERAFAWPETPIITITGWNEWIVQRQACGHPACPCSTYPNGCFLDQYDLEYSRDIEPGANEMGTYYYDLMKACIALFRAGNQCDAAHAADVCCRNWVP